MEQLGTKWNTTAGNEPASCGPTIPVQSSNQLSCRVHLLRINHKFMYIDK